MASQNTAVSPRQDNRAFVRALAAIAGPIALQNLINFGVGVTGSIMVGSLGETAIAAVSLANQVSFIFLIFCFGFASGGSVLIAQYWGKRDTATINKIVSMTLTLIMAVSSVFTLLTFLFPGAIMRIFTPEAAMIAEGAKYLKWVSFSYLLTGFATTYNTLIRSVEEVKYPLFVGFVSFVINIIFNALFIFGLMGLPALGVIGAAVGTLAARASEVLLVLLYMARKNCKVRPTLRGMVRFERWLVQDYFRHALPVIVNEALWATGTSIHAMILGRISSAAVAATSIVGTVNQLASVAIFGVGNAAAVLVGKAIGADDREEAKAIAARLLRYALAIGVLAAVVSLFAGLPIIGLYNIPDATRELAVQVLYFAAAQLFFMAIEFTTLVGILRAGGDVKFVLVLDFLCMWLFAVPLGALCGLVWHLPVPLVYIILKGDTVFKALGGLLRVRAGSWMRNITRVF